jgi:hypothetical protein
MKLSKTTVQMATRRGLELNWAHQADGLFLNISRIADADNDSGVYYRYNADESFSFDGSVYDPNNGKTFPVVLEDEMDLRRNLTEICEVLATC